MGSAGSWAGGEAESWWRLPRFRRRWKLIPADPGQLERGSAHPHPPGGGTPKLSTFVSLMRGFLALATSGELGWGVNLWALGICVKANIPGY